MKLLKRLTFHCGTIMEFRRHDDGSFEVRVSDDQFSPSQEGILKAIKDGVLSTDEAAMLADTLLTLMSESTIH